MKEGITKREFIQSLESTLKLTREGITSLELEDEETLLIHFKNNYTKKVNIACNSALAIIKDVVKAM